MQIRMSLGVAILLAAVSFSFGQGTTGTISGTVKDSTGAVVPQAKIVMLNEDTGISRTVQTDGAGRYTAPSLNLGNYEVTASSDGFQTAIRKGIVITVGREAVVNFDLNVGAVAQTVEVTGEAPLVESTTSSLGALVDDRTLRDLPLNGRSYDQLALLQPGVVKMGGGGFSFGSGTRFTVAGGRPNSNSFMLDGTDINDQGNSTPGGASGNNLGVDTIREFKILTNTYSAEYGRGSGAVISTVTKSGTNEFHGSLFEYLRNSAMDARDFFDPGANPPPFKRNQFGGTVGGPIKHDKTFFFGGYEGLRDRLASTRIALVPTVQSKLGNLPAGSVVVNEQVKPYLALWPDPNGRDFQDGTAEYITAPSTSTDEDNWTIRVDHQLNSVHSIFGRYTLDDDAVDSPGTNPLFGSVSEGRRQYSTLQLTSIMSSTTLNTFRFAFNRTFQLSDSVVSPDVPANLAFVPGLEIGNLGVGAIPGAPRSLSSIGTSGTTPRLFGYNLFQWNDDFDYVRGSHTLKFGANIERIRDNTSQNTSYRGQYTFSNFRNFLLNVPQQFEAPLPGQNAYRGFRQTLMGFYAQDDFKATPSLTLNLGLRWSVPTNPTESTGKMSQLLDPLAPELTPTDNLFAVGKKNLEPRFGFAWTATANGRTVVRGGAGIFHSFLLPDVYVIQLAKLPPYFYLIDVDNPTFPGGYSQLVSLGKVNARIQTMDTFNKLPTVYQYNLGIQQQFGESIVVEVGYVGTKGSHLVRSAESDSPYPVFVNGQATYVAGSPRRNLAFADVRTTTTDLNSHYDGLRLVMRQRTSAGLQYQVSYNFSKAIDYATSFFTGDTSREAGVTMDAYNWRRDRGLSSQNPSQALLFNFIYPVPVHTDQRVLGAIFEAWTINGIGTFQTGLPFTVRLGFERSLDGNGGRADRPNLVAGYSNNPVLGGPDRYYDPNAFSLPVAGTYGDLGRTTVIGPGTASFDLSFEKVFPIREPIDLRFRAELFNLLNHPNFGLPNTLPLTSAGAISGSAGRITGTSSSARQIQFGLKVTF